MKEIIKQDVYIVVYKETPQLISAYPEIEQAKKYFDSKTQRIFKTTIELEKVDVDLIDNEEINE